MASDAVEADTGFVVLLSDPRLATSDDVSICVLSAEGFAADFLCRGFFFRVDSSIEFAVTVDEA